MDFEQLDEAGKLDVRVNGDTLDAYALGVLNLNLQAVVDKVAEFLLTRADLVNPLSRQRPPNIPRYRRAIEIYGSRMVRTRVDHVSSGSLYETLSFAIPFVLADPNVRAILQNLAANIVWAISISGIRGIVKVSDQPEPSGPAQDISYRFATLPDIFEVGPNARDIIQTMAESNAGKSWSIEMSSNVPGHGRTSVRIEVQA